MITALDYRKMKGTQEYRVWAGGPGLGILKGSVRMTPEGADNARTALSAWLTPQGFIPTSREGIQKTCHWTEGTDVQSSQDHRGWTYLFSSLQSSPPFPPGSYEIVCRLSVISVKQAPGRRSSCQEQQASSFQESALNAGHSRKFSRWMQDFQSYPNSIPVKKRKKKLIFKNFKCKPRKIRAWIMNYRIIKS